MKTIIVFISLLFCVASVSSQTNYYTTTKTFYENGYTYQCDVAASRTVTLYNKSNKWTYVEQVYKSSGEIFIMPDDLSVELIDDNSWKNNRLKLISIVNNAFSATEKQRVRGDHKLGVVLYINPVSGRVDELHFTFVTFNPFAVIPLSVYRKIETEIKKELLYVPTSEGRKLNYIGLWWSQEVK
ncbi:DUF5043 domain-containing protein [Bacteroides sp. 51]|uniref:DUF5043 domain-containing protein n=1 Tax=Bacteroides sp. 51 TaxID=2302938 RepID=UPI0013D7ED81|nr:DUF5043 domain-containing protein [Bacteroides sp. 51]NDV84225.1 DUF5043 domain-containing protein [Bacteroides sp. 51]